MGATTRLRGNRREVVHGYSWSAPTLCHGPSSNEINTDCLAQRPRRGRYRCDRQSSGMRRIGPVGICAARAGVCRGGRHRRAMRRNRLLLRIGAVRDVLVHCDDFARQRSPATGEPDHRAPCHSGGRQRHRPDHRRNVPVRAAGRFVADAIRTGRRREDHQVHTAPGPGRIPERRRHPCRMVAAQALFPDQPDHVASCCSRAATDVCPAHRHRRVDAWLSCRGTTAPRGKVARQGAADHRCVCGRHCRLLPAQGD